MTTYLKKGSGFDVVAERDADASVWARALGMGPTMFKSIRPGQRFVFSMDHIGRSHDILVKTANGYRCETGGRQFTTGQRTACFVLPFSPVSKEPMVVESQP